MMTDNAEPVLADALQQAGATRYPLECLACPASTEVYAHDDMSAAAAAAEWATEHWPHRRSMPLATLKLARIVRGCTVKAAFNTPSDATAAAARHAEDRMYPYRCRYLPHWHLTSTPQPEPSEPDDVDVRKRLTGVIVVRDANGDVPLAPREELERLLERQRNGLLSHTRELQSLVAKLEAAIDEGDPLPQRLLAGSASKIDRRIAAIGALELALDAISREVGSG